jgi:hypothetical protein
MSASIKSHFLYLPLCLLTLGCGEKPVSKSTPAEEESERMLVGEIAETVLAEMRYKRITDGNGGTVQGGATAPHEFLKQQAENHKPSAIQWAGVKSLDPIPGKGSNTFFRYKIISELYPDAESAKRRDEGFDAAFRKLIEEDGYNHTYKAIQPVTHFAHGRLFYLLTTDMSASSDPNEAGKIRFALLRHLTR